MQLSKVLEQHIAVFGESGSGKTVLVSSFYGAMQEPQFLQSSLFDVTADDTGPGPPTAPELPGHEGFGARPEPTEFSSTPTHSP
jgi:GTPase SAR1 family protein